MRLPCVLSPAQSRRPVRFRVPRPQYSEAMDLADEVLTTDLNPPALEQWRALVNKVLDRTGSLDASALDVAFVRKLTTVTDSGISLQPLYTHADELSQAPTPGSVPFTRGASAAGAVVAGWDVRALHGDPDTDLTATQILADLEGGVTSLWIKAGAYGVGLGDLSKVLEPVLLDLAAVVLDAADEGIEAARILEDIWAARGLEPDQVSGNFGLDPIGTAARTGNNPDLIPCVGFALATSQRYPNVRNFVVDGLVLHEAGATDVQELAGIIAIGTQYVRALVDAGLPVDQAFDQVEFRIAATADQFATIAKLRAARRLWSRVAQVSGAHQDQVSGACAMKQHVVTSWAMLSRRDPWVNLLRGTVAGFAAGVGGAHSVTVLPFDAAIGLPDAMSRRLARNTSALLIEESHVGRVVDPAGGSWFVESLTDQTAQLAWTLFTQIESRGGFSAELAAGRIATDLAHASTQRQVRIAHRKDALTGVSEFPNVYEVPVVREPAPAVEIAGLPRIRYAQSFEVLRDRADAAPKTPVVLLAALGEVSDYTARTTFAKNFYESGGIRAEVVELTAQNLSRFENADLVCLCSSDEIYSQEGLTDAALLTDAGVGQVHLAGSGGELTSELNQAGVNTFITMGIDVVATLTQTLDSLGVQA